MDSNDLQSVGGSSFGLFFRPEQPPTEQAGLVQRWPCFSGPANRVFIRDKATGGRAGFLRSWLAISPTGLAGNLLLPTVSSASRTGSSSVTQLACDIIGCDLWILKLSINHSRVGRLACRACTLVGELAADTEQHSANSLFTKLRSALAFSCLLAPEKLNSPE